MTREDSIRTRTWVTEDGRCLVVDQIDDDHLGAIRDMLLKEIAPGYDQTRGRKITSDFMAGRENLLDYTIDGTWAEMELDAFRSAWLQLVDDELRRRFT